MGWLNDNSGAVQAIAVTQPLVSDQPLPHDPSKLLMLGSANQSVFFCVVRSDAPVIPLFEDFDDWDSGAEAV